MKGQSQSLRNTKTITMVKDIHIFFYPPERTKQEEGHGGRTVPSASCQERNQGWLLLPFLVNEAPRTERSEALGSCPSKQRLLQGYLKLGKEVLAHSIHRRTVWKRQEENSMK